MAIAVAVDLDLRRPFLPRRVVVDRGDLAGPPVVPGVAAVPEGGPLVPLPAAVCQRLLEGLPELVGHDAVQDRVDGGAHVVRHSGDVREGGVDDHSGRGLVHDVDRHQALGVERSPA